jgi:hypothetical protein
LGRVKLRVLAECYANKCFAEILEASIEGVASVDSIVHSAKMGRDKVLKKAKRATGGLGRGELLLLVIDYERGAARRYVEVEFRVLGDLYGGTLHIARSDDSKAIAVIFDPDIEEFLCRVTGRYCRDDERRELKSGDQDVVCGRLLDAMKPRLAEIQSRVAGSLVELITNTS